MGNICNHKGQRAYERTGKGSFLPTALLSILLIFLMLVTSTTAWFVATARGNGTIQTGSFGVKVQVSEIKQTVNLSNQITIGSGVVINSEVTGNGNVTIMLDNGTAYRISLTMVDGASAGYCKVKVDNQVYHTVQLFGENRTTSFDLNLSGTGTTTLVISPCWGSYRDEFNAGEEIAAGSMIGDPVSVINEDEASTTKAELTTEDEITTIAEESTEAMTVSEESEEPTTVSEMLTEPVTESEETTEFVTEAEEPTETTTMAEEPTETTTMAEEPTETTTVAEEPTETTTVAEESTETTTMAEEPTETTTVAEEPTESTTASEESTESTAVIE